MIHRVRASHFFATTLIAFGGTAAAQPPANAPAKTIVYCADASPEGFDAALWHTTPYFKPRGFVMSPNGSVEFEDVVRR